MDIKNNYFFKNFESINIVYNEYWDFNLANDKLGDCIDYATNCKDSCSYDIITDGLVTWFDVNNTGTTINGSSLTSLVEWSGKIIKPSSGFTLNDWGLTGVDNGRATCLSGETLIITSADTKLVLYPVTGYTITYNFTGCTSGVTGCTTGCTIGPGLYSYPWTFHSGTTSADGCPVGNTICLGGGFYQGFFKLDTDVPAPIYQPDIDSCCRTGYTLTSVSATTFWQVMPTEFPVGWSMETWIKWDNEYCQCKPTFETITATSTCDVYIITWVGVTVSGCNVTYTNCEGNTSIFNIETSDGSDFICSKDLPYTNCTDPITSGIISITTCDYCLPGECVITATTAATICTTGNTLNDIYPNNRNFFFYIGTRAENKFWNDFSGETGLKTSTGIPLSPSEAREFKQHISDGSQSWFEISRPGGGNCCCSSGTTSGCKGDCCVDFNGPPTDSSIITGGQNWFSVSSPVDDGNCCNPKRCITNENSVVSGRSYSYCDQLSENALGFRITDDGRIGYRKMTVSGDCYNNKFRITGTMMEEGYSEPNIIPTGNTWTHIAVTYTAGSGVKNTLPSGTLRFWVNGLVKYKVENFIGLQLRALNEWSDKQIGVPFNMSWGGGTQGLAESQTFGGPDYADRHQLLETNFAGTFEGELSQLRFYEKPLNVLEVRNNFFVDCRRYCHPDTFGGAQIVQPGSNLCGDCKKGPLPPYIFIPCD